MEKSLFKNAIYKVILNVVNLLVPLLIGPYIMRLLDVELYGMYNRVYAEFQLFLTFGSLGLYNYAVRELSKVRQDKQRLSELFSNLFLIGIISNGIMMVVYLYFAFSTSEGLNLVLYCIMTIQIVANILNIEFTNEALENYGFITIKSIIVKLLYLGGIFIFVRKPDDIIVYTLVISGTVFLNSLLSYIYIKKQIFFDFSKIKLLNHMKHLFLLVMISNIEILYGQLDKVLLGRFVSDVAVTFYTTPIFIPATLSAIPYSIIHISIPRLNYLLKSEGKEAYEESLKKVISSMLFLIIPMCFGVIALAPEIMFIYAGDKYVEATSILVFAGFGRIVTSLGGIVTHFVMYPQGQEKRLIVTLLGCGLFNLFLKILLITTSNFSTETAILTTILAELIFFSVLQIQSKYQMKTNLGLFTKQNFIYLILGVSFLGISACVKMFNLGLILNVIIVIGLCVSLYFGVLMFNQDENLKTIKNNIFKKQ